MTLIASVVDGPDVIEIARGETASFLIVITDEETGALKDLTGAFLLFVVGDELEDDTPVISLDTDGAQLTIQDQITNKGEVLLDLLPANTTLAATDYKYDVWVEFAPAAPELAIGPETFRIFLTVRKFP